MWNIAGFPQYYRMRYFILSVLCGESQTVDQAFETKCIGFAILVWPFKTFARQFFFCKSIPSNNNVWWSQTESYIEIRIRLYQKQKIKSSESLIPDENSAIHHLKRTWFQCFILLHCLDQQIQYPNIDDNSGWSQDDVSILPVWYTCSQLQILSASQQIAQTSVIDSESDSSNDEEINEPQKKRSRIAQDNNQPESASDSEQDFSDGNDNICECNDSELSDSCCESSDDRYTCYRLESSTHIVSHTFSIFTL